MQGIASVVPGSFNDCSVVVEQRKPIRLVSDEGLLARELQRSGLTGMALLEAMIAPLKLSEIELYSRAGQLVQIGAVEQAVRQVAV
jgi:hypothetical protein